MAGARSEIGKSMAVHLLASTASTDNEYVKEDILQITEFEDAFEMGEDMGVDMRGLDELDETKQRLIMHIEKKEGSNYKQEVAEGLVKIGKDDVKKKKKLIDLLDKFRDELEQFAVDDDKSQKHGKRGSAAIESLLKTEGATSSLEIDFQQKIDRTKNNDCLVVVSGETSAGKSSVLNLLIGEKILPVHHNPCTSVITRIAYGKQRTAKIVFKDGRQNSLEDLEGNDKWKTLWDQIYVKDENERELATDIKEVRIFVPAILLKCGLVLVDSPGIGENDAMDEVITTFVGENDIMGFLYIVKSNNAGGVDEDRLGSLLKVIMEKQKKKTEGGATPFDPKCAIFVCNMWDLVKEHDRDIVFKYAVTKLGLYWPGLTETQVVTMSASKAQREVDVDPQYILPEYKHFLDDLKELFVKALDRRVKTTYKWLENILVRSVHHLKTIVRRIDNSEVDLATTMKNVHIKLTRLKENSHHFIQTQRIKLDTESKEITRAFREELKKPQVKFRICQWLDAETPSDDDWDTIKTQVKGIVLNRIVDEFCKWEEEHERIETINRQITQQMKSDLHILQEDVQNIESDLQSETSSISSEDFPMGLTGDRRTSVHSLGTSNRNVYNVFNNFMQETEPHSVRFVTKFLHPVDAFRSRLRDSKLYNFAVTKGKVAEYKKNPRVVAKRISEKYLQKIAEPGVKDQDVIAELVDSNLEKPRELLAMTETNIPALIETNEELMDHISMCRVSQTECRDMYEQMMTNLEMLKKKLIEYGSGYIYVDDFVGQRISLNDDVDESTADNTDQFRISDIIFSSSSEEVTKRHCTASGQWTRLQNGFLSSDDEDRNAYISIKVYLPLAGITEPYAEVTKLRLMDHPRAARFLGIKHSDSPLPALIFDEHIKSLRRYKMSTFANLGVEIPRILNEIWEGIEYLHSKKMVHMELSVNTVTVNLNGEVKLTGACLPRCAAFPMDKETINAGDFVYLSPDVLKGQLYVTCADIYALGLLVYEVLLEKKAFESQRGMTLDRFIDRLDPISMLDIEGNCNERKVSESTKNLIQSCVNPAADNRPKIQHLKEQFDKIKGETCITSIKRQKSRAPIRKKSSQIDQSPFADLRRT